MESAVAKKENFACSAVSSSTFRTQVEESISPHLNQRDKQQLRKLLHDFADVFDDEISESNITYHKINTGDTTPIKQRTRRQPYAHHEESARQIKQMLDQGIIQPSTSPWSSPIILVRKKSGELRFCVD